MSAFAFEMWDSEPAATQPPLVNKIVPSLVQFWQVGSFRGRFEWDAAKAEANLSKHKISFESAAKVFDDPNVIVMKDRIDETGEQRWNAIGNVEGVILLLVTHVYRGKDNDEETIRIISARRAGSRERRFYLQGAAD
jgi:uncharacterized DUF497 family protein